MNGAIPLLPLHAFTAWAGTLLFLKGKSINQAFVKPEVCIFYNRFQAVVLQCVQVTLAMRLGVTGQLRMPIQVDKTVTSLFVTIQGPVGTALLEDPFGKHFVRQKLCGMFTSIHFPYARTWRQQAAYAMRCLRQLQCSEKGQKMIAAPI
jgi:hypothetical protein